MAISYAPASARPALEALLALDTALGAVVRSTREPMLGQIRLTWWHDALEALDLRPPPAEPVLTALTAEVLPRGVTGARLAAMTEGWQALLVEPLDDEAMARFADARGGVLFGTAAVVLGGAAEPVEQAGEGWALADLRANLSSAPLAEQAARAAEERLGRAFHHRWSRAVRPLGAMALLARADLAGVAPGSPRRVARLLRHRLTGR